MWTGIAWCVSAPSFGRRLHHKRKCSLRFFDREWLSTRTANHRRYDGNGEWRFESDQMPNSRNRMPFEFSNFVIANHTTRTKLIFSHIYFFVPFLRRWKTIFLLTLNKHYYLPSMCVCVFERCEHMCRHRDEIISHSAIPQHEIQCNPMRHWCVLSCQASYRSIPSRARVTLDKRRHIMVPTKT